MSNICISLDYWPLAAGFVYLLCGVAFIYLINQAESVQTRPKIWELLVVAALWPIIIFVVVFVRLSYWVEDFARK